MHVQNHLCVPTVPNSEAELLNILQLPLGTQNNGQFATDLQICKRTSNGDPRARTFHQMRITLDETACIVKGVLNYDNYINLVNFQKIKYTFDIGNKLNY